MLGMCEIKSNPARTVDLEQIHAGTAFHWINCALIAPRTNGSFSAAGRRLRRAQSVVSQVLAIWKGNLA